MNKVKQRRNNIVIFSVEFHNVGKPRNKVVKMTISKKNKNKSFQIEYTEFKVLSFKVLRTCKVVEKVLKRS